MTSTHEAIDRRHAREALHAIDPGCDRETWHRIGRAAIAAGLSVDDLVEWSASAPNFASERDVRAAFRTIKPNGATGPGTLWREAMAAGWRVPKEERKGTNGTPSHRPGKAPARPQERTKAPARGMSAAEVWNRCEPATPAHPYIVSKGAEGAPLDSLRVVPEGDPLRIAGLPMAGALVLPVLPLAGGEAVSLQFIAGPEQAATWKAAGRPGKVNLPGAAMSGAFVVGELARGEVAYIVEGIGQAWACWRATGRAGVVTFGAGRMRAVAAELRERDGSARLVLVPDAGKEADALRIAADVGALVATMPEGSPPNFDACDYAQAQGADALEALLAEATPPPEPAGDAADQWRPPAAITESELLAARLSPRCIVADYLFADVGVLVAPGSTGKTTTALYEAACIVLGLPLWGLRVVTPGPVLVVTAEDRREYLVARLREIMAAMRLSPEQRERVRALVRIEDQTTVRRRLTAIVADVVTPSGFAEALVRGCKADGFAPVLVQFDPMVSFGVGEARVNDAEQAMVDAGRVIVAGLDCAVRFVHHTGKAVARERIADMYAGRGGSALADGARMVHVMHALDEAELAKATGERLGEGQSAFALSRPKVSYAPPSRPTIYVRRAGFAFEHLRALEPQTGEERLRAVGDQLARFIEAEHQAGRLHTQHTLEQVRPESLSRQDIRAGIAWLSASGRLWKEDIRDDTGKAPSAGARACLRASNCGEATARRCQ